MPIPLELIMGAIILISLILYALLGGADFGGGVWDLLAFGPRRRQQQEVIAAAISPVWEANHVWLILVIVLLFTAFPRAFSTMMIALHIPMTAILIGIVLRGSAFIFRKYDAPNDAAHRRWSTIFGVSSFLTPFFLGVSLGALATGDIRIEAGRVITGFFAGWTTPFAIACGLFAQGLFAFLAATYLTMETGEQLRSESPCSSDFIGQSGPALQADFRWRALAAGVSLAPAAALVFLLSRSGAPYIFNGLTSWWAVPLLLATSLFAIGALAALWFRRYVWARLAAASQVALILLGWGLAQYPHLIVPDITVTNSAAPALTMRLLLWGLAAGAVVLLPSLAYLFYIFKGYSDKAQSTK